MKGPHEGRQGEGESTSLIIDSDLEHNGHLRSDSCTEEVDLHSPERRLPAATADDDEDEELNNVIASQQRGPLPTHKSSERLPSAITVVASLLILLVVAVVVAVVVVEVRGDGRLQRVGELRLNEIQMVGTHNSYHLAPPEAIMNAYAEHDHAQWVYALNYSHIPLPLQLSAGCRHFKLDLYYDPPPGGRYRAHAIDTFADIDTEVEDPEMKNPGYKVLHMNDLDYLSTCLTFVACLREIFAFSEKNPGHFPISVNLQMETYPRVFPPGAVQPIPMTLHSFRALEKEILSVFPREKVLVPADVKQESFFSAQTLSSSEFTWPSLNEAAGKIMFVVIMNDASFVYTRLNRDPAGPFITPDMLLFPSYAVRGVDDSIDGEHAFPTFWVEDPRHLSPELVREGHFVLTRGDANTFEARMDNFTRLESALAKGAHVIQTDYPEFEAPNPFGTSYVAKLPDGALARCNPISSPSWCSSVEHLLKEPLVA